jgi:hypothetical protein
MAGFTGFHRCARKERNRVVFQRRRMQEAEVAHLFGDYEGF